MTAMKSWIPGMVVALVVAGASGLSAIVTTAQAQPTLQQATPSDTQALVVDTQELTLAGAKQAIAAAVAAAQSKHAPGGSIAVVDRGGHLIALERLDNTFAASAEVAIGKARTAALFRRPTQFFEDAINNGRTALVTMPDFTPLQGGVVIERDGNVIGAIGVSGAMNAQQDEELAIAGANALESLN